MAINPKDDYDKLVKLLYPSIEASGNVYYGQTRKLTMDEVLKKNDLGFESSIEIIAESEFSAFCWKLGPLKKSFLFFPMYDGNNELYALQLINLIYSNKDNLEIINFYDNEPNYILKYKQGHDGEFYFDNDLSRWVIYGDTPHGTLFARYKLNISPKAISNNIHSGNYYSYENDIDCTFDSFCFTAGFDPVNKDNFDIGYRKFFIDEENNYLYIKVHHYEQEEPGEYYYLPMYKPLTLAIRDVTTSSGPTIQIAHRVFPGETEGEFNINTPVIIYNINNSEWHEVEFNNLTPVYDSDTEAWWISSNSITTSNSDSVQFACLYSSHGGANRFIFSNTSESSGNIYASGDASSMIPLQATYISSASYKTTYEEIISEVIHIDNAYEYIAKAARNPSFTDAGIQYGTSYLDFMFYNNPLLKETPWLGQWNDHRVIYAIYMLCTSITSVKRISPLGLIYIGEAFRQCTSLVDAPEIRCYANVREGDNDYEYFIDEFYRGCASLLNVYLLYRDFIHFNDDDRFITDNHWLDDVPSDCKIHVYNYMTTDQIEELLQPSRRSHVIKHFVTAIDEEIYTSYNNTRLLDDLAYRDDFKLFDADGTNSPDAIKELESVYKCNYLVTSGSNNENLSINSFNKDEYNRDGSYNQEVYGYKCFMGPIKFYNETLFNSPIQFRNGIYSGKSSITDFSNGSKFTLSDTINNKDISSSLTNLRKSTSIGAEKLIGTCINTNCDPVTPSINPISITILPTTTSSYIGNYYNCAPVAGLEGATSSTYVTAVTPSISMSGTGYSGEITHRASIEAKSCYVGTTAKSGSSDIVIKCYTSGIDDQEHLWKSTSSIHLNTGISDAVSGSSNGYGYPKIELKTTRPSSDKSASMKIEVNPTSNKSEAEIVADEIKISGNIHTNEINVVVSNQPDTNPAQIRGSIPAGTILLIQISTIRNYGSFQGDRTLVIYPGSEIHYTSSNNLSITYNSYTMYGSDITTNIINDFVTADIFIAQTDLNGPFPTQASINAEYSYPNIYKVQIPNNTKFIALSSSVSSSHTEYDSDVDAYCANHTFVILAKCI